MIERRFGTARGLVRLALAHGQVLTGRAHVRAGDPAAIDRFVFVCQGNICRSAFAEAVARDLGHRAVSVGLSTAADKPAHAPAIEAAAALNVDLTAHRTTRIEDYAPREGDFMLAMEVRQLGRLAGDARLAHLPRALLGTWAKRPHLHDPYGLDDAYMATCLAVIREAVVSLTTDYPRTALSAGSHEDRQG